MRWLVLVLSCSDAEPDLDGDGWSTGGGDCDDDDVNVRPGVVDPCDGADNDCDGQVDEDDDEATVWYPDRDGDGWGDGSAAVQACSAPADGVYVEGGGDCDDTDAAYHPGADESDCADPNDYDCDGWGAAIDADGDGSPGCEDCDDDDPDAWPGGVEACADTSDGDCDGDPQNGCGRMEGALCGLWINGNSLPCEGTDVYGGCPTGYARLDVVTSTDTVVTCVTTEPECDGGDHPCDPGALPAGLACGLVENDTTDGLACADADLWAEQCPDGFTYYGHWDEGAPAEGGIATCIATSGASTASFPFVCDLSHTYHPSEELSCSGGFDPAMGSDCPDGCERFTPTDNGASSGSGWTGCVCG